MTHSFWKAALKAAVALTTVISLASCKEETPNDPFANKPEKTNPTTLADVNKAEEGTSFTDLQCLTVVAANAQGLILPVHKTYRLHLRLHWRVPQFQGRRHGERLWYNYHEKRTPLVRKRC